MGLPKVFALRSITNNKYLVHKDELNEQHDVLQFSGDDPKSSYARFQQVPDEQDADLVHIKSTHNGKYWIRASESSKLIVAGAFDQQENQNRWSCTLFKPEAVFQPQPNRDNRLYRFRHVQLQELIAPKSANALEHTLTVVGETLPDDENNIFIVIKLPE